MKGPAEEAFKKLSDHPGGLSGSPDAAQRWGHRSYKFWWTLRGLAGEISE